MPEMEDETYDEPAEKKRVEFDANMLTRCTNHRQGKAEKVEDFLARLTHLSINDRGLRKIKSLEKCERLKVLYLYNNFIEDIEHMDTVPTLNILHIYNNRIRDMKPLYPLHRLTKLFLNGNCISRVEGLENLQQLEQLHLSNQRLRDNDIFTICPHSFQAVAGSLTNLDISGNGIVMLPQELHFLHRLEKLNISRNHIEYIDEVTELFGSCPYLADLDLKKNPVVKAKKYWQLLVSAANNLVMLDGKVVDAQMKKKVHNFVQAKINRPKSATRQTPSEPNINGGAFLGGGVRGGGFNGGETIHPRGFEGSKRRTPRGHSAPRTRSQYPHASMPGYQKFQHNSAGGSSFGGRRHQQDFSANSGGGFGQGQGQQQVENQPGARSSKRALYDPVHRTKSDEGYVGAISKPSLRPVKIIDTNASSTGNPLVTTTPMANPGDKAYSLDGGGYWGGFQAPDAGKRAWQTLRSPQGAGALANLARRRR